jgi:uncharacterized membrane protein
MSDNNSQELLELTRRMIDLKREKKQYNSDMNEQIKAVEAEIKRVAKGE